MNLYKVTCYYNNTYHIVGLFVANSEQQAETFGKDRYGDGEGYRYNAELVNQIDGYSITVNRM